MKQPLFELIVLIIYCILSCCRAENIICLTQGKLRGSYNVLGNYWSYFGVPYAKFMGRYKEPGDPPSWDNVYRANLSSVACKQYSSMTKLIIGQEDCFHLNVYTPISPSNTTSKLLSVMVFIHGGGFHDGSNTDLMYNPRFFMQKDVVVVVINYRVGVFGFLCLNNKEAPGNMGLKDQLAALKWVKNNIASFGGDPCSITLFGESAGAACVSHLILTQTAKGLFHRAIMESGSSLTPHAFDPDPIVTASQAASRLGYNTSDSAELLAIYLNATADDLAIVSYKDTTNDALAQYIFKPCKEEPNTCNTPVLTASPRQLVKSIGDISDISIIIGYNSKEGIFWAQNYDTEGLEMLDKNFSSAVPNSFTYRKPKYKAELINDIRDFYFDKFDFESLTNYYTDVLVMAPCVAIMTAYLSNPKINMYNYYFNYDSLRNLMMNMSKLRNVTRGAAHTDELYYLFDPIQYRFLPSIPEDKEMIDTMTSLWTNFAKTGVPSTPNINWPRSESMLTFLKLDKKIEVIGVPNPERVNFWMKSYEKYLNKKT